MDPAHERDATIAAISAAVTRLEQSADGRLIPPEGISFGFAMRGARDSGNIAAVRCGIEKKTGSGIRFGTDEPVVRIILTLIKFNPAMRSVALLQYSDRALAVFENDLFLDCAHPGKESENKGISTMDWSIASSCRDGVPDVIIRKGAGAPESRIVLTGESPADVVNNIIICSNRL